MDFDTIIGSVSTVVSFVTFGGIVVWAWAERRCEEFSEAAHAPFAVPDEIAASQEERRP